MKTMNSSVHLRTGGRQYKCGVYTAYNEPSTSNAQAVTCIPCEWGARGYGPNPTVDERAEAANAIQVRIAEETGVRRFGFPL